MWLICVGDWKLTNSDLKVTYKVTSVKHPNAIKENAIQRSAKKYMHGTLYVYVVSRNFFLLLLNCSVWPCLVPA